MWGGHRHSMLLVFLGLLQTWRFGGIWVCLLLWVCNICALLLWGRLPLTIPRLSRTDQHKVTYSIAAEKVEDFMRFSSFSSPFLSPVPKRDSQGTAMLQALLTFGLSCAAETNHGVVGTHSFRRLVHYRKRLPQNGRGNQRETARTYQLLIRDPF